MGKGIAIAGMWVATAYILTNSNSDGTFVAGVVLATILVGIFG